MQRKLLNLFRDSPVLGPQETDYTTLAVKPCRDNLSIRMLGYTDSFIINLSIVTFIKEVLVDVMGLRLCHVNAKVPQTIT